MFKWLSISFCFFNFALTNVIEGSLSAGFRWDTIRQKGPSNIETTNPMGFVATMTEFDREIATIDLIGGTASVQGFFDAGPFFNTRASFSWIVGSAHNDYHHTISGIKTNGRISLSGKQYALDLMGALGWQIKGLNGRFNFIPQAGGGLLRMKINHNNDVEFFFPLVGADFRVLIERYWNFISHFYYLFLGGREEHIELFNGQILPVIKRGFVHGYELSFRLGYQMSPTISFFVEYLYRQAKAKRKRNNFGMGEFLTLETRWVTNHVEIGFGYIF